MRNNDLVVTDRSGAIVATLLRRLRDNGDTAWTATIQGTGESRSFTCDPFNPDGALLKAQAWIEKVAP
tara:strand:+ start:2731 stop:2934 length:204 start_codon:yes stop_codon:yes gene_type:complete